MLERLARAAASRPAVTLGIVLALALGGGALALRLQPNTSSDTFVSRSSPTYQASLDDNQHFGGDPVVILIREPLTDLVETKDLATVSQLEACLAGQVVVANQQLQAFTPAPAGIGDAVRRVGEPVREADEGPAGAGRVRAGDVPEPRGRRRQHRDRADRERGAADRPDRQDERVPARARQGTCRRAGDALENAAGQIAQQQETTNLLQMYLNSGISGQPTIDDPQFIPEIVFDQTRGREPAQVPVRLPVPDRRTRR